MVEEDRRIIYTQNVRKIKAKLREIKEALKRK